MAHTRSASLNDVQAISELLARAKLPSEGVGAHVQDFVVVESDGALLAVGGLEVYGRYALLRSVAVVPQLQGEGVGSDVCDRLDALAKERGVESVYLLTETAVPFFMRRGYEEIARDDAPPEIAATEEFSRLCPASAVLMRRAI